MRCWYTREHIWMKIEDKIALLGLSRQGMDLLGEVSMVDLPLAGQLLPRKGILAQIETLSGPYVVQSPLSGMVLASNWQLDSFPEILSEDPEGDGWIARVELIKPEELRQHREEFMDRYQYREYARKK